MKTNKPKPVFFASVTTTDIDMITVKTLKAIQAADVLIIDCLLKSKIEKLKKKNAEIIRIPKKKWSDEEEHRSHVIKVINTIGTNYALGKKVIRLVDAQTFLSKHIHTEFRLLKSRNIETKILPEPGVDYHTPNQLKNVSFFSINCQMRNTDSLWHKLSDCYNSGQCILLYSTVDIRDQLYYRINNDKNFQNAQIDIFNINDKKSSYVRLPSFNEASVYYIAH
jgi:hypothetical protein